MSFEKGIVVFMEFIVKIINYIKQSSFTKERNKEHVCVLNEISDVCKQLKCTDRWFDMESDHDLIEACIYQREELLARYRYLMRVAKNDNINSSPFTKEVQ